MTAFGGERPKYLYQAMDQLVKRGFKPSLDPEALRYASAETGFEINNIRVWTKLYLAGFGDDMASGAFSWAELRPLTFQRNHGLLSRIQSGELSLPDALPMLSAKREKEAGMSALERASRPEQIGERRRSVRTTSQVMDQMMKAGFKPSLDPEALKHASSETGYHLETIRVWTKLYLAGFGDGMASGDFSWSELKPLTFQRNRELVSKIQSRAISLQDALPMLSARRERESGRNALDRASRLEQLGGTEG